MNTSDHPSRRAFLKSSSAVLAGAAMATQLGVARSAHAAGGDEIKIALIGCGGRGTGAAMNCLQSCENVKLVALADAFEDNAKSKAEHFRNKLPDKVDIPDERVFTGFDAYQKAIDAGVDMVILATPPGFRPMQYKAAVAAGKHIFMEKPCCVDAPGFRLLMETNKVADEKNLKVGVGLQRHHQASYVETLKRIRDGAIGDLQFLRVYWNGGGVWNRRRKPEQTEMEYQMRNWYYFVWLSGDHICEQHVHNLDIANWIKDSHPVEANGMGGREVRKFGPDGDFGHIYDHHANEFTYADGSKMFSQCRHIRDCSNAISEFAHGTKGTAELSYTGCQIHGPNAFRFRDKERNPFDQEHVDLVDAIRNNKKYNEGWHGATSSMTAVLGRMATYSGKVVTWDEAVASGPDELPEQLAWDANPRVLPDANGSYEHAVAVPGVYKPY